MSMQSKKRRTQHIFQLCLFAMLGTIMFCLKIMMEFLPNIHLVGMLTMVYTLVFRAKALIPIYLYILLDGLFSGFRMWWIPYLYIWTVLWGITMLLPKRMPPKVGGVVYPLVCAFHGLAFGILYAPGQALMFGLSWKQTVAWILAGLPWDAIHMVGNFVAGLLILPLRQILSKLVKGKL